MKTEHVLDLTRCSHGLDIGSHDFSGEHVVGEDGDQLFLVLGFEQIIKRGGQLGVKEIVMGMPHRGRLNVLVNTLGKMPKDLFAEFDDQAAMLGGGDEFGFDHGHPLGKLCVTGHETRHASYDCFRKRR